MSDINKKDKIDPDDNIEEIITEMSEGNPGALTVLTQIVEDKDPIRFMNFAMKLDSLGMYGSDIWLGYKDHCDQDVEKYHELVMDGDQELIDYVENYPDNVV